MNPSDIIAALLLVAVLVACMMPADSFAGPTVDVTAGLRGGCES